MKSLCCVFVMIHRSTHFHPCCLHSFQCTLRHIIQYLDVSASIWIIEYLDSVAVKRQAICRCEADCYQNIVIEISIINLNLYETYQYESVILFQTWNIRLRNVVLGVSFCVMISITMNNRNWVEEWSPLIFLETFIHKVMGVAKLCHGKLVMADQA